MFSQYPLYGSNQQAFANGMQNDIPMPMPGLGSYGQPDMSNYSSYEMNKPQYARGGHVGLHKMGQMLQKMGQDDDSVLAHISPEEAEFLAQTQGGDINPQTGLSQFGRFSRTFRKLRSNKIAKVLLNVIPAVAGYMVAGPAGAAAAGALGGSLSNKNPLKGGLLGGAIGGIGGYGYQALAPHLGGLGGLTAAQKAATLPRGGAEKAAETSTGGLSGLLNNGLLGGALLGTAVLGTALGRHRIPHEPSMRDVMAQNSGMPGIRQDREINASPLARSQRRFDRDIFAPGNLGQEEEYYENVNPQSQYFEHGGYVDGHTDGQADKIPAMLSDGEFVIPADVTSALGAGNNKAGAKKLYGLIDHVRHHQRSKPKGLPPKPKAVSEYMRGRR